MEARYVQLARHGIRGEESVDDVLASVSVPNVILPQ